jgi:hypothetical protein
MRIAHAAFLLTMAATTCLGQAPPASGSSTPSQTAPSQNAPNQAAPGQTVARPDAASAPVRNAGPRPSALLQPSLDGLQQAVGGVQLEKWRKGSVRDEAGVNVSSIQKDLQSTLPPLLAEADAGTISKVLPVERNISALYDVLLRVVDGARIAAPGDQFMTLQNAMADLEKARQALSDQMQDTAVEQEKQIGTLQVALKTQPVPVCPVAPPPAPAPAPAKKPAVKKRKPATPKPATPPTGSTPTPNPPKPSNQ